MSKAQPRIHYLIVYIVALLAFAATLAASWIYWYGMEVELYFILGAAIFAGLILLGDVLPIRVSETYSIGAWDIGMIVAIATVGPTWAAIAALPAASYSGKRDWLRTVFEVGHTVTIVYLAGIVFSFASTPLLEGTTESIAHVLYGTFAASLTLFAANKTIMVVLLKIKYGRRFRETWKKEMEPYLPSDAVNLLTAGLAVLTLLVYGPVTAIIVVVGAIVSQVLVYRSRDKVEENQELKERIRSLEESLTISNTTFGMMMIQDLGHKDGYTHRHAAATAMFAVDLAREMKLDDLRARRLRMAGLLHNIGLFGLPNELLVATGKLNSIAKSELTGHPARGEAALAAVPELREMAGWVRWHHERVDGRGYPDKLRDPWIPLEAKILAVTQAYAAMVLDQPRRPGMSFAEAREALISGIETQFDGEIVRAMLRILDTETEGYRMADDHRFVFPDPRRLALSHDEGENLTSPHGTNSSSG